MRKIQDYISKEVVAKAYPIFKGYPVKTKNKRTNFEEHYIVPWEMNHVECKHGIY